MAAANRFNKRHVDFGWQSTKEPSNMAVICIADTLISPSGHC